LWNKARHSVVMQIGLLFVVSFIFIVLLWLFFNNLQKTEEQKNNINRYFNIARIIQPLLMQAIPIYDEDLSVFDMKLYAKTIPKNYKQVFKKGNTMRGFEVFELDDKRLLYIYNHIDEVLLEDIKETSNRYIFHILFLILLIFQALLYISVQKLLRPLSLIRNKLKTLQDGDSTPLEIDTSYDEISQMVLSYNKAVQKIRYMLNTREMLNKIFMHELKMPIAKGMFYLKAEPSWHTQDKLKKILIQLNQELDKFAQLESLISYDEKIDHSPNKTIEILHEAIAKIDTIPKNSIQINCSKTATIKGDRQLWVICFKNIIENSLRYSPNNSIEINSTKDQISFINIGEPLPIDISGDVTNWKLTKYQRNKSSTGYGFGLYIIKTITTINRYKLDYSYDKEKRVLKIAIFI